MNIFMCVFVKECGYRPKNVVISQRMGDCYLKTKKRSATNTARLLWVIHIVGDIGIEPMTPSV